MACWEATRVTTGGLTFFPKGMGTPTGVTAQWKEINGIMWRDYDSAAVNTSNPKYVSDGSEGWLAHISNSGLIFIKVFADSPDSKKAPNENEVEVYSDKTSAYTSLETQGPYGSVAAGATTNWKMRWYLRQLPANIKVEAGNATLAAYVRNSVARWNNLTGLSESAEQNEFVTLFPNPASSSATVFIGKQGNYSLGLVNALGQEVKNISDLSSGTNQINTSDLNSGIYFYKVISEGIIVGKGRLVIE